MRLIDAEWIKSRLTGKRGEKAALARAMNVDTGVVSRILSGERQIKPAEMLVIEQYFDEKMLGGSLEERIDELLGMLHPEERRFLLGAIEGILAQRHVGTRK